MNDSFNPYFEWLGIDQKITQPDFYQLLELEAFESDPEKIALAADKATARVRSFRPGANAPHWAKLLDEISTARRTFKSPVEKETYDNQLRATMVERPNANSGADQSRGVDMAFVQANKEGQSNFYPPGFSPDAAALATSPAMPAPTTTVSNVSDTAATQAATSISPPAMNMPPNSAPVNTTNTPAWNAQPSSAFYPPGMVPPSPMGAMTSNPMSPMSPMGYAANSPMGSTGGGGYSPAMNPANASGPMYGNPMAANPMSMAANPMASAPMASFAPPGANNAGGTIILPPHANPLVPNSIGSAPFANSMPPSMSPYGNNPAQIAHIGSNPMMPTGYPPHGGSPSGNPMAGNPMPANPMMPMGGGYGAAPGGGMSANPMAPAYASPGPMSPNAIPTASMASHPMNPMSPGPHALPASVPTAMAYGVPGSPSTNYASPMGMASGQVPMAQIVQTPPGANIQVAMGIPVGGPMPNASTGSIQNMASGPLLAASPATSLLSPEGPQVRSQSTSSKLRGERSQNAMQMPIILGIGGGLVLLTFAAIYVAMGGNPTRDENRDLASNSSDQHGHSHPGKVPPVHSHGDQSPTKGNSPSHENDSHQKRLGTPKNIPSAEMPENTPPAIPKPPAPPKPKPKPPEPMVALKPETPVTSPTPTPIPIPVPTPPPAMKKPTREEVRKLAEALKQAHLELSELNVDDADKTLKKVEKLTMLPEHAEKLERLKQLIHYDHEFLRAMREACKGFQPGATIQIGSTVAAIVETFPNKDQIILRIAGMNRNYQFRDMPVGLAVAVANEWLDKKASSSLVVKACFVMTSKKSNEEMHKKAHEWLNEAKRDLSDVVSIVEAAFVDNYDLMKDFKE